MQSSPAEPKHPSVNGVEIWTEQEDDGDIKILGKDEQGSSDIIGWINKEGGLTRSNRARKLNGIPTDEEGKIQLRY